jgi:hypothetical protein
LVYSPQAPSKAETDEGSKSLLRNYSNMEGCTFTIFRDGSCRDFLTCLGEELLINKAPYDLVIVLGATSSNCKGKQDGNFFEEDYTHNCCLSNGNLATVNLNKVTAVKKTKIHSSTASVKEVNGHDPEKTIDILWLDAQKCWDDADCKVAEFKKQVFDPIAELSSVSRNILIVEDSTLGSPLMLTKILILTDIISKEHIKSVNNFPMSIDIANQIPDAASSTITTAVTVSYNSAVVEAEMPLQHLSAESSGDMTSDQAVQHINDFLYATQAKLGWADVTASSLQFVQRMASTILRNRRQPRSISHRPQALLDKLEATLAAAGNGNGNGNGNSNSNSNGNGNGNGRCG